MAFVFSTEVVMNRGLMKVTQRAEAFIAELPTNLLQMAQR